MISGGHCGFLEDNQGDNAKFGGYLSPGQPTETKSTAYSSLLSKCHPGRRVLAPVHSVSRRLLRSVAKAIEHRGAEH
jgi:hypothetical protein